MRPATLLKHPWFWIPGVMIASTLLVHLPFYFKDFTAVYRHWDGPFYLYLAKTFYIIPPDNPFNNVLPSFYAGFLPVYPILIRLLTPLTAWHYPQAMLLATIVSSCAAAILFFQLLKEWRLVNNPVWTILFFCFLPPRWLLVHSIGANEPLFLCFIFGSFLAYHHKRDWIVLLLVTLACITRPPGFLLVLVFGFLYWRDRRWKRLFWMPAAFSGIVLLFVYYRFVFGDFFAFFYLHLDKAYNSQHARAFSEAPFAIYQFYSRLPNFHSTDYYALLYILNLIGILALWNRKELFVFCLVFYIFTSFQFTFDLPRYAIPYMPFSLLVGFDSILSRRSFRYFVFPLAVCFAYMYAWGFLPLVGCTPEAFQTILAHTQR